MPATERSGASAALPATNAKVRVERDGPSRRHRPRFRGDSPANTRDAPITTRPPDGKSVPPRRRRAKRQFKSKAASPQGRRGGRRSRLNKSSAYHVVASVNVVVLLVGVDVEDQVYTDQKCKEPKNEPNTTQKTMESNVLNFRGSRVATGTTDRLGGTALRAYYGQSALKEVPLSPSKARLRRSIMECQCLPPVSIIRP
ncbi:hypothetical protein EVAR_65650_1 [Eumeta japonica]|uniref:Uncharacterized protein n=1 Tax=Eumeta variegata TaxID=151549 RepID=A0A4C1Z8B5_EUMVA|nr:hypothetical protein EVAR_65650_1 [Eumeta japonica]